MSKLNPNAKPFVPGAKPVVPGAKAPPPKPGPGTNPAARAKLQGAVKKVSTMNSTVKTMSNAPGAKAIQVGDKSGGHLSDRHIGISHGQMIDRLHGKDPGQNAFKDKQRKPVVTKFASAKDAQTAMSAAMKNPAVKAAAANTAPGKVSPMVKVNLPPGSKVTQEIMKGPGFLKDGKKKIPIQGPANLIKKDVKSVNVAVRKDAKGNTGLHTGYSDPD